VWRMRPARRCSSQSRARGRTIWTVQTLSCRWMTRLPRRQWSKVAEVMHKLRPFRAVCHLSFTDGSMPDNDGSEDIAMSWGDDNLSGGDEKLSGGDDNLSGVGEDIAMSSVGKDSLSWEDRLSWIAVVQAAGLAEDELGQTPDSLSRVASRRLSTTAPRSAARCRAAARSSRAVPVRTM
jgi:hypothetical protein